MKKLIALFSMVAFFAAVSVAQTPAAKADAKPEATKSSCCMKANTSCCKNNKDAKACTPEQKAECAKAGSTEASTGHAGCSHGKAEANEKSSPKDK